MSNSARRLILRRIFGGVAALAALAGKDRKLEIPHGREVFNLRGAGPIAESRENGQRNRLFSHWSTRRYRIEQERRIRELSYSTQDPDLIVLASTSPAWRASIMRDRLMKLKAITDRIESAMAGVWQTPLEDVEDALMKLIDGD